MTQSTRFPITTCPVYAPKLELLGQALARTPYIVTLPIVSYMTGMIPEFFRLEDGLITHDKTPTFSDAFIQAWGAFALEPAPLSQLDMFIFDISPERVWILPDGLIFGPNNIKNLFSTDDWSADKFSFSAMIHAHNSSAHGVMEANAAAGRLCSDFSRRVLRPSLFRPILQRHKTWEFFPTPFTRIVY